MAWNSKGIMMFLCMVIWILHVDGAPTLSFNTATTHNDDYRDRCLSPKYLPATLANYAINDMNSICAKNSCVGLTRISPDNFTDDDLLLDDEDLNSDTDIGSGEMDDFSDATDKSAIFSEPISEDSDFLVETNHPESLPTDPTFFDLESSHEYVEDNEELQNRSLCPWTYVRNIDPDRYPEVLMEAKCIYPECGFHLGFSSDVACQTVTRNIAVLRRVPEMECISTNEYQYKQTIEPLAVACTCGMNRPAK